MKKLIRYLTLILLWNTALFAANNVKISRIIAGSVLISNNHYESLVITEADTLHIFYSVEDPDVNPSDIQFKAFLNAKIVETRSFSVNEHYTILSGLDKGPYIFKVQAFNKNGWEANSTIMQFAVGDISSLLMEKNPEEINQMDDGIELKTIILYGLIALSFIQLLIIGFLFMRKRKTAISEKNFSENKRPGREHFIAANDKVPAGKKSTELIMELKELNISYSQLKKELDYMKETNSFLKNQITSLQLNVKNLEEANLELASQKDKLMESKRQLQELQAQKDELFAMAVHDIKNPAAAIRSYVELLESYDLNANEQQQIMHSLVDTSFRIVNLAQQMSVIILKQAPEPKLSLEPASIKQIIDSICNRNYAYAKRKNIKLINNSSPHTPKTLLDITKMEEVIDNLINNAIKFASDGTIVQIRTFFSESKITVEVEDNGVGLSEEDTKKAFEKGARLTAQPTGGETSSGLGLWIVKNIIDEHGGTVWVKSKPGMGSTFAFELPMAK